MDDRSLVSALRTGEVRGLAGVYDGYADRLLAYAGVLLPERRAAEAAVHDALLVARERGARLPEDRLRPWLYALVRNECLRQLRQRRGRPPTGPGAEPAEGELRRQVRLALATLDPGTREVLELSVRHELSDAELGTVLQVDAAAAERARTRLERELGALLVATAGPGDCPELAGLLAGWTGTPAPRLTRHVASCPICQASRPRDPVALLAGVPFELAAPALRERVLGHAELLAYQQRLAERAGPWRGDGFPVPLGRPRRPARAPVWWSAAAVVVLVVLVAAGLLARPDGGAAPLTGTADEQLRTALPAGDRLDPGPGPSTTSAGPATGSPGATASAAVPFPTGTRSPTPSGTATAAPTASGSPTHRPTAHGPTPTTAPPTSPSPTATPTTPPPPEIATRWALTSTNCPDTWRARLTATVTGATASTVTAVVTGGSGPSSTPMTPAGVGVWTVVVPLPADAALRFTATATTAGGRLTSGPKPVSHTCP